KARTWFDKLPPGSIDNWGDLQKKFLNRFGILKACDKDPTEISRSSGEATKLSPTLKKELPKGEFQRKEVPLGQWGQRNKRHQRMPYGNHRRMPEHKHTYGTQEHHAPYVPSHRPSPEFRRPRETKAVLTLDTLVSTPQEILAMEHRLHLPQPAQLLGIPSKGEMGDNGTTVWRKARAISSTIYGIMKFPTPWGIATLVSQAPIIFECRREGKKKAVERPEETKPYDWSTKKNHQTFPQRQPVDNTDQLEEEGILLRKSRVITKEVAEWLKAGIVRPVKYPTWISNPVLVKMAEEDEEKTAFYTDQGTYCYTKMPFGLKNARATYQRLVDESFQSQIRRNLEVYVDDIVVKSKSEREMLADIAETFDNLRRINMKLNPKSARLGSKKESS
nr:reverse transcriptase domain-containing protein [Tanacetum cinerariifolium]